VPLTGSVHLQLVSEGTSYAEGSGCRWYILSAEHGLVAPNQQTAPYERTLNLMPIAERRAWAKRVADQLATTVPELRKAVFLAGAAYLEFLADQLTVVAVTRQGEAPQCRRAAWLPGVRPRVP
jgi:hypothetical protein